jgi:hypothetical protein
MGPGGALCHHSHARLEGVLQCCNVATLFCWGIRTRRPMGPSLVSAQPYPECLARRTRRAQTLSVGGCSEVPQAGRVRLRRCARPEQRRCGAGGAGLP